MAHVIENPNHPCAGKSCNDCETCIFDVDIDDIQPKANPMSPQCGQLVKCFTGYQCEDCEFREEKKETKNNNIMNNETCNICQSLIKNYVGDGRLVFNACCGKVIIDYTSFTRPRVIKYKTGQMLAIETPEWCPKKHGIDKQVLKPIAGESYSDENEITQRSLPARVAPSAQETRPMTYYERREKLKTLPKHLAWDEIQENGVYVIPKLLSQARKVVKVIMKTENLIRTVEINEHGDESTYSSTIYPNDLETVFITKIHKY